MTMIQPSTMAPSSLQLRSYLSLLVLDRGSNLEHVSISIYCLSPQCRGWFIEENNRKHSMSAVVVACSHICDFHLVEHIWLYSFQYSFEIG